MGISCEHSRIIELPEIGFPDVRMPALDYDRKSEDH